MDNTINSLVSKAVGVTDQQIKDFLATGPSDAQIVKAMKQYGVSPTQLSSVVGVPVGEVISRAAATIPNGQSAMLGDVVVQPIYDVQGSGQDQQVGPITSINVTKSTGNVNEKAPVGSQYQTYAPDGTLQNTGIVQKYDDKFSLGGMLKDIVSNPGFKIAALAYGANALGAGGIPNAAGTTFAGETLADAGLLSGSGGGTAVSSLGADYGLGGGASTVPGMGGGTGITTGYSGLGVNPGTVGLGADGLGAGVTAANGLTGTGVLTGSTLGTNLLGSSALNNLANTGVLAGSTLGTNLLGVPPTALTNTGVLSGSTLGTNLLGTGPTSGLTTGVTGLTPAVTPTVFPPVTSVTPTVTPPVVTTPKTVIDPTTGLIAKAVGDVASNVANQQGITDARNLINQYGTQAATSLADAYKNAQGLNVASRTDLGNIYKNTSGNIQDLYNQQVGYQDPYQDIGRAGSQGLLANQDYLTRQFGAADLNANLAPNYAFQLAQGQMANQRAANMGGGSLGGNALQGLQRYTQDYAGNAYQQAFNNFNTQRQNIYGNLSKMADIGTTSGGQLASLGNTLGGNLGSLSSNYGSNLTTGYGQGIGAANAYGLNTANLATGIGGALASNAAQTGANNATMLSNLGNTALLSSMIKAT